MDPLDLQLQDVIGDLESGVLRVIDSPAASSADRGRAMNMRATLDRMRDAVVEVGEPDVDAASEPGVEDRIEALRRRASEILEEDHDDDHVDRIDATMNDTIQVMSVVGKWPPND